MEEAEIYETKHKNPFEVFIAERIEEKGLKLLKLQEKLKMTSPTYYKLMKDPVQIKYAVMKKMAVTLEIDIIQIINKLDEAEKFLNKNKTKI